MKDELVHSVDYTKKENYFSFVTENGRRHMSHEEEVRNILSNARPS